MVGVPMTQAGLQAPVLVFPCDDDIFPFEGLAQLFAKAGWWTDQDRHIGIEIVDSAERRWVVSGLCKDEPPKRRWWQLRAPPDPGYEIELQPLEPEAFAVTRQRVQDQASPIFPAGDEALADIAAAATMAELSAACFEITIRAQALRLISGNSDVPVRTALDVARRAPVLFAFVHLSLDTDRRNVVQWLSDNALADAISPSEAELLVKRRWSEEEQGEAQWKIEGLTALLWALDLLDMPPPGEFADIVPIVKLVPPAADTSLGSFLADATLRSPNEMAAMAEQCLASWRSARDDLSEHSSDDDARMIMALWRRYGALQWILNPARLEWE